MCSHSKYSYLRKRWYFLFLLVPIIILGIVAVVMLLWNALLPDILNVSTITYWQAFGILILARILFGGFRHSPSSRYSKYSHMSHLRKKWLNMSDEERKKYREEWKKCCSYHEDETETEK